MEQSFLRSTRDRTIDEKTGEGGRSGEGSFHAPENRVWPMFGNVRSDFNMQPAVTSRQVRVRDRARVKWVASTRETLSRFDGMLFRENTFIALPPSPVSCIL